MATPTDTQSRVPAADFETPDGHPDLDAPPPADDPDPAAPYGRRSDGTPRSKPGRKPGTPNVTPRARAKARPQAAAPPPRKTSTGGAKRRAEPDYRGGIMGLFQLTTAPLLVAGARSDAMLADAATLTTYGPGIADALHALALERPEVAAVLERLLQAGPYGALLAACVPLGVQLAANHGLLPPAVYTALGGQDPKAMVAAMRGEPAPAAAAA